MWYRLRENAQQKGDNQSINHSTEGALPIQREPDNWRDRPVEFILIVYELDVQSAFGNG